MKTRLYNSIFSIFIVILAFLSSSQAWLFAGDAPTYRGKVVLVVDKTIAADPEVSWRIERLINDLTGDGWRVLRHDVDRGPEFPLQPSEADAEAWALKNAPRVREIRALIQADYRGAPTEVKNVFLLGHVPVPYSGTAGLNGGHYSGAEPADTFYGEMTGWYGVGGWTDTQTELSAATTAPWIPSVLNRPGDGKFDQDVLPSPMKLGVGRVDLCHIPDIGVDEATLVSRYLDKDHDFRCSKFSVQRRVIVTGSWGTEITSYQDTFGAGNVLVDTGTYTWFPNVSASGQDYLLGEGGAPSGGNGNANVGTTAQSPPNDFLSSDSRVVFVNLWGSWFGNWDSETFLKAPLANPYDPANGRYGYGLGAFYWNVGLDDATLTNRQSGATIGEALLVGRTTGIGGAGSFSVNYGLMGDPTLRLHAVQQPGTLSVVNNGSAVGLSWSASGDLAVTGYNVYSAPTRKGPYVLVNTNPITGTSYSAMRASGGSAPDNFYMVRAIKPETTPVGSYTNMADGVIAKVPGALTPYLSIISQPVNQTVAANTKDGIANSVVFTVDAVGSDSAGSQQIIYQWYNASGPLSDDCHFKGVNTSSLLISGLQASDAGSYHVVISNSKPAVGGDTTTANTTIISSTVTLGVSDPPTGVDDTESIIRNTPTDFDVLANDTDLDTANSALTVISVSGLSDPTAGTLTINSDHRTIHFTPAVGWLGVVTFTYTVFDGTTADQATVTVTVNPTPGDTITVSSIADQQMTEDTTIDIPFTVSDGFTTPDNLSYVGECSTPALLPSANFSVTGTGNNRVLHLKAGTHQIGSGTVTFTVTDYDLQSDTATFNVTISPANVSTLLPTGLEPDGFHFTINGPANSTVEIKESSDLVTWVSLGNVTLSGNLYDFVDTQVGSATQRFYSSKDQNGCSANVIGFVTATLPTGSTASMALANPLNNPVNNSLDTLFAPFPKMSSASIWDSVAQGYTTYRKGGTPPVWLTTTTVNPGTAVAVHAGGTTPVIVTFIGDVPTGTQVNSFTIGTGTFGAHYALLSSTIPRPATLDQLGFPVQAGDQIQKLASDNASWTTVATYTSGVWTPAVPSLGAGESFFLVSANAGSRTWTENFSSCSPEVSLTSPADGSTFVVPSSIALSATASSDAGISKVEFFQGTTSLGLGTLSGSSYSFTWSTPGAGTYSITAHATDNNGITTISLPAIVTVQPSLGSESYSSGTFQFTITGSGSDSVIVKASQDLVSWTSLGAVTLTSGSYVYSDATAGTYAYRFYRTEENGVCSANTVGFENITVPTKDVNSVNQFIALANQLNNPAGNTVDILFPDFPKQSQVETWTGTGWNFAQKVGTPPVWNATPALNPGVPGMVHAGQTTDLPETLIGEMPQGQQVQTFVTATGSYYLLGSIIPRAGTLNQLGFPAMEGDQLQQFISQNWTTTATYSSGAWSSSPTIQVGEAFFIISGGSGSRTWTENLPACAPSVMVSSPTDGSSFVAPSSIALSATATADSGISTVEFFQGATSLGSGTQSGNSYTFNWTSPGTGTYSITAHATDNDGITTISLPVSVTVYGRPSLSAESYSSGTYQFTISGSAGVSVALKASQDLASWTSLGTVTLTGGTYNYSDTGAGSFAYRFYRVEESGVTSANTVGFITVTVPAKDGSGVNQYLNLANQLNNPAGNTVDILFPDFPKQSQVETWSGIGWTLAQKGGTPAVWNSTPALNPGQGAMVHAGDPSSLVETLVGEVPQGQQVNTFTTTTGGYLLLSSIIPRAGNLQDLGFPAAEGDQIQQFISQVWTTTATYTSGAWSPSAPSVQVGEPFFLIGGNSGTRTWTETY